MLEDAGRVFVCSILDRVFRSSEQYSQDGRHAYLLTCPMAMTSSLLIKRRDLHHHICSTIPNGEWAWAMPLEEGHAREKIRNTVNECTAILRATGEDGEGAPPKLADDRKEDAEALAADFMKRHPKLLPTAYSMTWVK